VGDLCALREDRDLTDRTRRQLCRESRIVDFDPDRKRDRLNIDRRWRVPAHLQLSQRIGLQNRYDITGMDFPGRNLKAISTGCPGAMCRAKIWWIWTPTIVSSVSMNAITGTIGNGITRDPLRRVTFVTYPAEGARTIVLSKFHLAASSCARRESSSAWNCCKVASVPAPRYSNRLSRSRLSCASLS